MKYICRDCNKVFDEGEIVYEYIGNDPSIPIELDEEEDAPLEDVVYDCPYCGSDDIEPYYDNKINEDITDNDAHFILFVAGALLVGVIIIFIVCLVNN